jgi:hypothetical protein
MSLLLGVASTFPLAFTLVYAVGFVAAVGIGSIAWYNSKRPPGWEDTDRPDIVPKIVPKVDTDEKP